MPNGNDPDGPPPKPAISPTDMPLADAAALFLARGVLRLEQDISETPIPFVAGRRLLLKRDEAAAVLSISPRTLWSLTNSGRIPCIRIGHLVRYSVDDLQEWIASNSGCSK